MKPTAFICCKVSAATIQCKSKVDEHAEGFKDYLNSPVSVRISCVMMNHLWKVQLLVLLHRQNMVMTFERYPININ